MKKQFVNQFFCCTPMNELYSTRSMDTIELVILVVREVLFNFCLENRSFVVLLNAKLVICTSTKNNTGNINNPAINKIVTALM